MSTFDVQSATSESAFWDVATSLGKFHTERGQNGPDRKGSMCVFGWEKTLQTQNHPNRIKPLET